MDNPFIYLRGLRHAEHTVFGVNDGQKYYFDPQFGRRMAYSSGQQVKRSVIEALNMPFAAITFNWEIDKKEIANREIMVCIQNLDNPKLSTYGYIPIRYGDGTIRKA